MADNVTIPATGSGTATPVIATDDVSGVQFQRVKLDVGGDGATVPVLAGTGAAASALRVALADSSSVAATQSGTWTVGVSGTVAISAAALPLPSGAATAAKQPAIGTAGTASADVITVQGVTSMVALKVDGSAVTQPVSGTVTIQDGGGSITVDGTVAASQSGTWTVTGAGGTFPVTDSGGSLTVDAPVGTPVFVRLSDGSSAITSLAVTATCAGDVADDAADSGNPVKIGAKCRTSMTAVTPVAGGDRVNLCADSDGVQFARLNGPLADIVSGTVGITDGSSTSVISAAGAGVKIYVTTVIISNSSATAVTVDLRDGTGGSVKATFPVPATGGVVLALGTPLGFSANTAVAADPSAAATTVSVTLIGFKSPV